MILIIVILLILAIYWEYKDYIRIAKRNCIDTIPDDKRERELKFYATFMSKNNIVWRFNFILCFISFCAIMYVLKSLNITTNINRQDYYIIIQAIRNRKVCGANLCKQLNFQNEFLLYLSKLLTKLKIKKY